MHDRIRDSLIAIATAWAVGIVVRLASGSRHAGEIAMVAALLPLFALARMASHEYWRRKLADERELET